MIVMFRDPTGRSRSEYNYYRQAFFRKQAMSRFDATIMHKTAGRCDFDAYLDFMLDHTPAYANLAARYIGWDGNEDLSRLFARDVFHSGVLERSDVFARTLVEKLHRPVSFPHDNRTGKNRVPHVTSAQRRKSNSSIRSISHSMSGSWRVSGIGRWARYGASARRCGCIDAEV